IDRHGVAGSRDGLLRLASAGVGESALRAIADRLGLPRDYVEALSPAEASLRAGVPIAVPAWWFPGGGWVDPRGLARSYLERAGSSVTLRLGIEVAALRRVGDAWQLVDDFGAIIATAEVVVLANAGGASGLLAHADWPIARVRGQVSALAIDAVAASAWPKVPVAGAGYALPPVDGRLWFGATSQVDDADTSVRDSDHADNLARLATWLGGIPVGVRPVAGRTGWREVSEDRLPVIGAVAAASAAGLSSGAAAAGAGRFDQPRFIARAEGLFACTALGSRGIAFSALGAQVLASAVTGAPCPLDADLIDAVDPARFISRAWRRAAVQPGRDTGDQPPPGLTAGAPTGA
ncbi:MAG: FAD-dependent 5-carboxymethylaminomethyl-2-thiouridine(34) oxidoreductase MnmC, partial [Caldimonas sp.]